MNNMESSSFLEVKVKDRSGKIAAYLQCSCVNGEVKNKVPFLRGQIPQPRFGRVPDAASH